MQCSEIAHYIRMLPYFCCYKIDSNRYRLEQIDNIMVQVYFKYNAMMNIISLIWHALSSSSLSLLLYYNNIHIASTLHVLSAQK